MSQLLEIVQFQGCLEHWVSEATDLRGQEAKQEVSPSIAVDSLLQLEPGVPACSPMLNLGGWSRGNHSAQGFREAEGGWAWWFLVGWVCSYK